jgi:hypothetical protein
VTERTRALGGVDDVLAQAPTNEAQLRPVLVDSDDLSDLIEGKLRIESLLEQRTAQA